jgi:hypothetical protein
VSSGPTLTAPDLWLVAGDDDELADVLADRAAKRDVSVSRVTFAQFARSVTVEVAGSAATVTPLAPILLRSGWESLGDSADAKFLRLESHAQAWAACALSPGPVINRPGEIGFNGHSDRATALSLARARMRGLDAVRPPREIYSSEWLEQDGGWAVQDLVTYATAAVPRKPDGDGPYRFRLWQPTSHYATVTVVDSAGWITDHLRADEDPGLIGPSMAILQALGLRFGAVTWGLPDEAAPEVARVEPYPPDWAMGSHLHEVADALLAALAP